jgi:hypothetical protein
LEKNNLIVFHSLCERWNSYEECLSASLEACAAYIFINGDNFELMQEFLTFIPRIERTILPIKYELLEAALVYGRPRCTSYLIENGAADIINDDLLDDASFTHLIIYKAIIGNNIECVTMIINLYQRVIKAPDFMNILAFAAKYSTSHILALLLSRAPAFEIPLVLSHLLIHAITFYNIDSILMLEQKGGVIIEEVVETARQIREDVIERPIEAVFDIVENDYDHSHFFDILMERYEVEAKSTEDKQRLFYLLNIVLPKTK